MKGFEDSALGGVPEPVYPEYLQTFELYNSVDVGNRGPIACRPARVGAEPSWRHTTS